MGELVHAVDRHYGATEGVADSTRNGVNEISRPQVTLTWYVSTDQKLVALTFDDGPRPKWTTLVLDTLDEYSVPATFFMIGRRVLEYPGVVDGRMGRHEVGNHTWDHKDLARRNASEAHDDLARAHDAIVGTLGVAPRLFRPPYGHLSGSAALAANDMGYEVVLWNEKMREAQYTTEQQIERVVSDTLPGTILLAHDVGKPDRLVSLRGLPAMISGLRERGFEFVTVSQLMAQTSTASKV